MVQTLKATKVTLGLTEFGLTQTSDPEFFQEWQDVQEEISTAEMQRLGQVKSNFSYLLRKPPFLEAAGIWGKRRSTRACNIPSSPT